ncbi:MAG TPA: hypothetical protein PK772_07290, partial [Chitinophagaceae bacterium]|nr:hypothetical protein [Chitinophagaceae bacterium]
IYRKKSVSILLKALQIFKNSRFGNMLVLRKYATSWAVSFLLASGDIGEHAFNLKILPFNLTVVCLL